MLLGLLLVALLLVNLHVHLYSSPHLYSQSASVPKQKVGLVLGTSQYRSDGSPNAFFHNRMKAAAKLYKAGKVDILLLSGDNRTRYYNEPKVMKEALLELGIPESAIRVDYAGLRTFDSVLRCSMIFGQERFTVISQGFHAERAIYIGRSNGLEVNGYAAKNIEGWAGSSTHIREWFARVKMLLDLYVLHSKPQHLGKPLPIK